MRQVAERDPRLAQRIVAGLPYIWAEVPYAIEQEMALTVTDVVERRLHLLNEARDNGVAAAPQVAKYLAEFLDWDKTRIEKELREYQARVGLTNKFR